MSPGGGLRSRAAERGKSNSGDEGDSDDGRARRPSLKSLGGGRQKRPAAGGAQSSSPQSATGDGDEDEKRRHPVKRACNECRQQKLRCDVVQDPFTTCTRCHRLKLPCKIEANFRRIGKRSRNAEMEREIIELRRQVVNANANVQFLAQQQQQHQQHQQQQHHLNIPAAGHLSAPPSMPYTPSTSSMRPQQGDQASADYMKPHEAVASLLDLKSGGDHLRSPPNQIMDVKRLEDVTIHSDRIAELFTRFFTYYHPFLPLLETQKTPDEYYDTSPLLFWTILAVASRRYQTDSSLLNALSGPVMRLVWSTLADVPQSYHVVKALALLCTWPFPTSSTSTDPTFMLCGMMQQIALQIGLHRPSHAQDFSKYRVELREGELNDRVTTWAFCNIVAQRVATGYGQPSSTLFDCTLSSKEADLRLPPEVRVRLQIEKFCDKISQTLYSNHRDPVGVLSDKERNVMASVLFKDFEDLEGQVRAETNSITKVYLRAAGLHLHLSIFFENPTTKDYRQGLSALYLATTAFLEEAFGLETSTGPVLSYCSNYIYQMTLAAGFSLFKLCNSFFAVHIDMSYTKSLFSRTISALRHISVTNNDLPQRLAEVLAQMWRMNGVGSRTNQQSQCQRQPGEPSSSDTGDSLMLKVRCRMSMSLVFDSVWRWREDFQARGRNFETYLKNPTNPDSGADSSASCSSTAPIRTSTSTPVPPGPEGVSAASTADPTLTSPALTAAPVTTGPESSPGPALGGFNSSSISSGFLEPNYEVFDPLNWMLDGLVDFPYLYPGVQGLEV
ncbi:C6 zinc finger domain-containing protein [Nannizzia gypsea CBS 118893]|uniref:C6 zinc finger domain-containing protein n=1 Tax=Arthroderma gypseum (strain ATCC MYA-4604 / CBS 118893) TaxID=535722 RepID=E4UNX8_ARTGP|nr:C6 zinc finger domain-containing protein [Nannizzia gypsea CBS 118893]EFQ99731.1 C6 zinc finger domain-containing protein [Nannizzia gypsea CBS 118893]